MKRALLVGLTVLLFGVSAATWDKTMLGIDGALSPGRAGLPRGERLSDIVRR